jgi:hypothetical protein
MANGITGLDGKSPVYEPDRKWSIWEYNEIYFDGGNGDKKYVPNVNDLVVNVALREFWYVVSVDETTLNPTLKPWSAMPSTELDDIDLLLGPDPSYSRDTYRAYINTAVLPYSVVLDARLYIKAQNATKIKVFYKNKTTGNEEVISAFYDTMGNLLGQEVPLELVAMPNGQNYSIKRPRTFYTSRNIPSGEVLTVVAYDDEDQPCSKSEVMVEQTAAIPAQDTSLKYILGISLESPFLSESDPSVIEVPMNVLVNNLSLIGVVNYSNGDKLRLPVDGTKFSIAGIQDQGYVATVIGQEFPIVLTYTLSEGEVAYGMSVGENYAYSEEYKGRTVATDGVYTPKLYCAPVWIDEVNGYRLEWYLYNLDRDISIQVTPYVRLSSAGNSFNPVGYGSRQTLVATVNLKEVNGTYKAMNFVQTVDVTLLGPGTLRTTNWTIGYSPNQNPPFGRENYASASLINQNLSKVKLDMGETDVTNWLNRLYYESLPLYDPLREIKAPLPNFFSLTVNGQEEPFPIDQWNSELQLNGSLVNNDTLMIKFYKEIDQGRLELAMCGVPIYQAG